MSPVPLADSGAALSALLRYVNDVRDRAVAEILARAEDERRTLLAAARRKAREQVSRSWQDEKRDADARVRLASAASQARLRRARQALTAAALEKVGDRIEHAVRERWRFPPGRRSWVALALAEATRYLPTGTWQLTHPAPWDPGEAREEIAKLAAFRPGVTLELRASPELEAGVRIACGPAELDASADGLLRERSRVEGLWLAEVDRAQREFAPPLPTNGSAIGSPLPREGGGDDVRPAAAAGS